MSCSNKQMFWKDLSEAESLAKTGSVLKDNEGYFQLVLWKKCCWRFLFFERCLKKKKTMFYVLFLHIYHFLTLNTCFNKLFTALFTLQLKKWAQLLTFFVLATKRPVVFMKKDTWWLRSYVFCTCPCFFFLTSYLFTKKEGVKYTL